MKWIKRLLVAVLFLVIGMIVGAIGASILWQKMTARFTAASVLEMAVDAYEIQAGRAEAVLRRKAKAIPGFVQQLDSMYRRHMTESEYNAALWAVARFYEGVESGVPPAIRPIMEALTPRPKTSCELNGTCPIPQDDEGAAALLTQPDGEAPAQP